MKYSLQIQQDYVAESVRARYAMIIPILRGMLYAAKREMVEALGGYEKITFEQFTRIYVESPGDFGICFEYAVHYSLQNRDPIIHPLISTVLEDFCNIKGGAESILFGVEKSGAKLIIETADDMLTNQSRVLGGRPGKPPLLKKRLRDIERAFRNVVHREKLPQSIRGLWKADLFLGSPNPDQWVATTLKTNRRDFEGAAGLRIGLYPEERAGEGPKKDDSTNLIMCPLPYSGEFMQLFGATFGIAKQLVASRAQQPSRVALIYEDDQTVAKWLSDRRSFAVHDILEALEPLKQPGLLQDNEVLETDEIIATAPIPLKNN